MGLLRVVLAALVSPALLLTGALSPASAAEPPDAVLKIYATQLTSDYGAPWKPGSSRSVSGSGFVIAGHRILTNAHVVSDATFIQVRRYGESQRVAARVLHVSDEADLALLTVDEPGFFDSISPLELGDLPELRQEILVLGFPLGGDTLSVTRGVVSRIESQSYVHANVEMLAGQIDSGVNPGNSGGPVLGDGKVVGVAMQVSKEADKVAYMIPTPVVAHFLADVGGRALRRRAPGRLPVAAAGSGRSPPEVRTAPFRGRRADPAHDGGQLRRRRSPRRGRPALDRRQVDRHRRHDRAAAARAHRLHRPAAGAADRRSGGALGAEGRPDDRRVAAAGSALRQRVARARADLRRAPPLLHLRRPRVLSRDRELRAGLGRGLVEPRAPAPARAPGPSRPVRGRAGRRGVQRPARGAELGLRGGRGGPDREGRRPAGPQPASPHRSHRVAGGRACWPSRPTRASRSCSIASAPGGRVPPSSPATRCRRIARRTSSRRRGEDPRAPSRPRWPPTRRPPARRPRRSRPGWPASTPRPNGRSPRATACAGASRAPRAPSRRCPRAGAGRPRAGGPSRRARPGP